LKGLTVFYFLLSALHPQPGEIVLRNNQKIKCAGPYEVKGQWLHYKNAEGDLFQLPLKLVDLDRSSPEDAAPPEPERERAAPEKKKEIPLYELVNGDNLNNHEVHIGPVTDKALTDYSEKSLNGARPGASDWQKESLAYHVANAIRYGDLDTLRDILQQEPPLEGPAYREYGMPLHLALNAKRRDMVRILLAAGAKPDVLNAEGLTPLQVAVSSDFPALDPIAQTLVENGADLRIADKKAYLPLHRALLRKNHALVNAMVKAGVDANVAMPNGDLPLVFAIGNHTGETVPGLLAAGADPNSFGRDGQPPLIAAVAAGAYEAAVALLAAGAEPNDLGRVRQTPLHKAVELGDEKMVTLLIAGGADPYLAATGGSCAMDEAVALGHREMVAAMAAKEGGIRNVQPYFNQAVASDDVAMAALLLDYGADVNAVQPGGNTLLISAARRGSLAMVKLLVAGGADVYKKSDKGFSAYMEARGEQAEEIKNVLRLHFKQ